jgi:hypothetical protein
MALDTTVVDSVANANFKMLAEQVGSNIASSQQRLQILAEKSLARSLDALDNTSVPEGLGLSAAQRGDLAKQISDLSAAVAGIQQMIKGAGNTPPVTP